MAGRLGKKRFGRRHECQEPLCHARTVEELTQQNVEAIAQMQEYAQRGRTRGERLADGFARIVGSWTFLIIQSVLMACWIVVNVIAWRHRWDPYPFILLNLALSFQAAYATPIIMMSENREARLSERRNQLDLQINLLAEQETTEILRLLRRLCEHHQIPMEDRTALDVLTQKTEPAKLVEEIERRGNK